MLTLYWMTHKCAEPRRFFLAAIEKQLPAGCEMFVQKPSCKMDVDGGHKIRTHLLGNIYYGRELILQQNLFRGPNILQNMDLGTHILEDKILCDRSTHVKLLILTKTCPKVRNSVFATHCTVDIS